MTSDGGLPTEGDVRRQVSSESDGGRGGQGRGSPGCSWLALPLLLIALAIGIDGSRGR